jgi:DNA invertase Pin-like site-specific DNA recombinase
MTTTERPAVALYRVSTDRQGQSGLGLEAQQQAVQQMASIKGLAIVAEFTEIESGRKRQQKRPQLTAALAEARRLEAVIVVAKMDRLARDAELILRLSREADANGMGGFLFCDLPEVDATTSAGRLILTVMASVAEFEARRISERTRAGLAVRKARNGAMGARLPHVAEANAKRAAEATGQARQLAYQILPLKHQGLSLQVIADRLHEQGVPTPSGQGRWSAVAVSRVLKRLDQPAN